MRVSRFVLVAAISCLMASAALASTVLGLSIEDQARLSTYVVVGNVVAQEGVYDPDNGLETEVSLVVTHVLKGDTKAGATLVFHTRGGEVAGEVSEAIGEAVFKVGQRTLVFIEEVDGRPYLLGLSMGAWDVQ